MKNKILQKLLLVCCFVLLHFSVSADGYVCSNYENEHNICFSEESEKSLNLHNPISNFYLSTGLGYPLFLEITNRTRNDLNRGIAIGNLRKNMLLEIALGFTPSLNEKLSFEVEAMYYKTGSSKVFAQDKAMKMGMEIKSKIEAKALIAIAVYKFDDIGIGIQPFLGVGVGASENNMKKITAQIGQSAQKTVISKTKKRALAYQVSAGLSKKITKNLSVGLKVKAMNLGKVSDGYNTGKIKGFSMSGAVSIQINF